MTLTLEGKPLSLALKPENLVPIERTKIGGAEEEAAPREATPEMIELVAPPPRVQKYSHAGGARAALLTPDTHGAFLLPDRSASWPPRV